MGKEGTSDEVAGQLDTELSVVLKSYHARCNLRSGECAVGGGECSRGERH